MLNSGLLSQTPLPPDYANSTTLKKIEALAAGGFEPEGDAEKAVQAIYEVVMGEGVGKGHEAECFLPLGRDLAKRVRQVQEGYGHSMHVFGEICNNVYSNGR